jgi:hypothetical protein
VPFFVVNVVMPSLLLLAAVTGTKGGVGHCRRDFDDGYG